MTVGYHTYSRLNPTYIKTMSLWVNDCLKKICNHRVTNRDSISDAKVPLIRNHHAPPTYRPCLSCYNDRASNNIITVPLLKTHPTISD